jgi:serine/threonine protein kinase/WD40 repeat protein
MRMAEPSVARDEPDTSEVPPSGGSRGKPQMLGKYRIDARLGKGGMSVVYQAEDTLLRRPVAIKILPRRLSSDPVALERFLFEARAVARLSHPNIVIVHDINESQGGWYLVMELVSGGSAQEMLRKRGPFPWREAVRIAADACRGLVAAHEAGVIHRDIKPGNILLTSEGVGKLADFGLAKSLTPEATPGPTSPEVVLGTPAFMSPEQCRAQPIDARTDIYSLGATLYTLLTQRAPFEGKTAIDVLFAHCNAPRPDPRSVQPRIPQEVVFLLQFAMAVSPADRFASARELLTALERILQRRESRANIPIINVDPVSEGIPVIDCPAPAGEPVPTRRKRTVETPTVVEPCVTPADRNLPAVKKPAGQKPKPTPPKLPVSTAWSRRWILGGLVATACTGGSILWLATRPRSKDVTPEDTAGPSPGGTGADPWWKRVSQRGHVWSVDGAALTVAVSPDMHWAAALTEKRSIYVWDLTTGQVVAGLNGMQPKDAGRSLLFTHDSSTLLTGGSGRFLRIGVAKAQVVEVKPQHLQARPAPLTILALVPDKDDLLVTQPALPAANGSELMILGIREGKQIASATGPVPGILRAGSFTHDGKEIVTLSEDGMLRAFDAKKLVPIQVNQKEKADRLGRGAAHGLAITPTDARQNHPAGPVVAVADDTGLIFLLAHDWAARSVVNTERIAVSCVAYAPTSLFWAAGLKNGTIRLRNNVSEKLFELTGHKDGGVRSVAFGSQGHLLLSGGDDRTVRLWNYADAV